MPCVKRLIYAMTLGTACTRHVRGVRAEEGVPLEESVECGSRSW